jgi:thiol:disulfide interchange protein DsbA
VGIAARRWGVLAGAAGALVLVVLGACGRHDPAATRAHQPSAQRPQASGAVTVNERASVAPAAEKGGGLTEESEGAAEPVQGRSVIATAVAATLPAPPAPESGRWVEGRHYTKLVPAEPTHVAPGRVEVLEVFWYGCAHCSHLDPALEGWRKQGKPAFVDFVRSHVMWNATTLAHARLHYTLKALGKLEELHPLVFREIHEKGNFLVAPDAAATEQLQRAFLKAHGISDAAFDGAYHSFAVDNDLRQAEDTTHRYKVTGVPMLIVNGKYTTDIALAGGEAELLELINFLAAVEHRR